MKATQRLHQAGQSLWLDNISRGLLPGGGLPRYIEELAITGLTSNPTIFDQAIRNSHDYDTAIREKTLRRCSSGLPARRSISPPPRTGCSGKGPRPSPSRGPICWGVSPKRVPCSRRPFGATRKGGHDEGGDQGTRPGPRS